MPNFCGGIKLDGVTLKVINGVICEATADSVNVNSLVPLIFIQRVAIPE